MWWNSSEPEIHFGVIALIRGTPENAIAMAEMTAICVSVEGFSCGFTNYISPDNPASGCEGHEESQK